MELKCCYLPPQVEVVKFDVKDVLTVSDPNVRPDDNDRTFSSIFETGGLEK